MFIISWDFNSSNGNKAEFTKFPVGITKIRVIDDEPTIRWTHWLNQFKRAVNCPGGKTCPICEVRRFQKENKEAYTYNVSKRFAINVINYETGKVEITEQGVGFFEDLRDLMNDLKIKGHKLSDAIIKVRRRGTGKDDTSYRLDIEEIKPISEQDKELIEKKTNLVEFFKPNTNEQIVRLLNGEEWNEVMKSSNEDEKETEEEIEIK